MINVGIIGATGYTAEALIEIILSHRHARLSYACAKIDKALPLADIFPQFRKRTGLICDTPSVQAAVRTCDVVFLALPHTLSMAYAKELLKAKKRVIDLSADYRLKDVKVYEKFYGVSHIDKKHLPLAVYGLPELNRLTIKDASLIANPGCYPTVSILALAPLVAFGHLESGSIIIDAKSGSTGAGKKVTESLLFSQVYGDFKAYKVNSHQHAPEIEQELSNIAGKKMGVTFVPHLLPIRRGILATIYARKKHASRLTEAKIIELYKRFYKKEPFIRVRDAGDVPKIADVAMTNFCDIGVKISKEYIIIIAAIDNLLKGASGQAAQNMNIMYGFAESEGLINNTIM